MKCLADNLIGNVRAIEVAGINVIDAKCYCFAQNGNSSIHIAWRTKDPFTRKLHRAVSHAIQGQRSIWECKSAAKVLLLGHIARFSKNF